MPYLLRRNEWMWGKPCSCCRQFTIDQAKKLETRAKRAAARAARPQNPPPETIQVTTVPTLTYPNLEAVIARQMNSYYGFSYNRAPTHDLYGCQLTEGGYNPWSTTRNWEE